MKPLRKYLKPIALFLAVTFLVQSCSVYHKRTTTVDKAVIASKKTRLKSHKNVKVKSFANEIYKFNLLIKEEGKVYGIAHKKSKTAKALSNQIVQYQSDNVKILLTKDQVNEIYIEDKMRSGILSILTIVMLVGGTSAIWYTAAMGGF
jgi:hypothetical protein